MKSIINKLSLVFIFLFTAAMVFTAYYLYIFPARLNKGSVLVDQEIINSLSNVFLELNIVIWTGLILGLIALMLQLFNNNDSNKNGELLYSDISKTINAQEEMQHSEQEEMLDQKFSLKEYEKILQGDGELKRVLNKVLWTACKELEASQAAIYRTVEEGERRYIELKATFAYSVPDSEVIRFEFGEGLAGQVAKEGRTFNINDVPEGYIKVLSGLGSASPSHLLILPIGDGKDIRGVMEMASFKPFDQDVEKFLVKLCNRIAEKLMSNHTVETIKEEQQNQ